MRLALVVPLLVLSVAPTMAHANSFLVRPDGAGDFPTIQAAVDAVAEGDTIVLAAGTFTGAGNVNVDSRSKGLLIKGEAVAATIIDCAYAARAFLVHDNPSSFFVIANLTITRSRGGTGGAVQCLNAAVEVRDAVIKESIACFGKGVGCIDGQANVFRCRFLNNACIATAPCYGAGALVCEGFEGGGVVSCSNSTLHLIDNYAEGNADGNGGDGQVVLARNSSIEMTGNRFYRNRTFDGTPTVTLEGCDINATANDFVENAAWTSGIHLIECTGDVRGNLFEANRVQVGPGGIESEESSVGLSFNFLRGNWGSSITCIRSTGNVARNLIVRTQGDCCGYGMAIQALGCGFFRVENNTLYENGVGSDQFGWASELHLSSQWAVKNLILHEEIDNVLACDGGSCTFPPPPFPEAQNWMAGVGAIFDWPTSGYCPDAASFDDPLFRAPAQDNYFLRPNSFCDVDTTIGTHVIKQFFGALPKGARPSGLLDISRPPDDWPSVLPPGASYALTGFSITNIYRYDASINYRVISPSGSLRDGGDPHSLAGATPVLAPGESFTPPPAALEVPPGNRNVIVKYCYAYAPALNIVDTVQTTVHFGAPVPVRVTAFDAKQLGSVVGLHWATGAGADVDGWHVYRAHAGGSFKRITGEPLPAPARSYTDANIRSGIAFSYRLTAIDPDEVIVAETGITPSIALSLEQNTPNPFRTATTLRFSIPKPQRAVLRVYSVDGKLVRTLLDETVNNPTGEVIWDGRDANGAPASSGVYFCRLTVNSHTLTRKIVLTR